MNDPWTQTDIFDHGAGPRPHARRTDPISSELTLASLGKDTSLNWRVFRAIVALSERTELRIDMRDEQGLAVIHDHPVTDDDIVAWMERRYDRRFQRNVIARQRGIIRELGWIMRVDDVVSNVTNRQCVAHIPTQAGLALWNK